MIDHIPNQHVDRLYSFMKIFQCKPLNLENIAFEFIIFLTSKFGLFCFNQILKPSFAQPKNV
jgi:hypothetical protein